MRQIEESEKAGSHWELNLGNLACATSTLPLSYHSQTTTSLHTGVSVAPVQYITEDCEGWWLSCCRSSVVKHWLHKAHQNMHLNLYFHCEGRWSKQIELKLILDHEAIVVLCFQAIPIITAALFTSTTQNLICLCLFVKLELILLYNLYTVYSFYSSHCSDYANNFIFFTANLLGTS